MMVSVWNSWIAAVWDRGRLVGRQPRQFVRDVIGCGDGGVVARVGESDPHNLPEDLLDGQADASGGVLSKLSDFGLE